MKELTSFMPHFNTQYEISLKCPQSTFCQGFTCQLRTHTPKIHKNHTMRRIPNHLCPFEYLPIYHRTHKHFLHTSVCGLAQNHHSSLVIVRRFRPFFSDLKATNLCRRDLYIVLKSDLLTLPLSNNKSK